MSSSRAWHDLIAFVSLVALALLAFPLLGSLTNDVVAQQKPQPTPLPARVYLLPFRQVFGFGASAPLSTTQVSLYENGTDVFQRIGRQEMYTHVQTLDGAIHFWTLSDNLVFTPPNPAQYDFALRDKSARLDRNRGVGCLHSDNAIPPFSVCQSPAGLASGTIVARITTEGAEFYLIQANDKHYFVSPDAVLEIR